PPALAINVPASEETPMTDQHDPSPATVLENAIAHAISRAQSIVDDGTVNLDGLAAADPEQLADALSKAEAFVAALENIRHEQRLDKIETAAAEPEPKTDDEQHVIGRVWNE